MMAALKAVVFGSAFSVAVLAATKSSVSGHWFWYLRACYFLGFGLTVVLVWFSLSTDRKEKSWSLFGSVQRVSFAAVFLALFSLPFISWFVDPSLVSNRSYGSVLGSGLVLAVFYGVWYLSAKKHKKTHNNRFEPTP